MTALVSPIPGQFPANTFPENRLGVNPDHFSQPFHRSYLLKGVYLRLLAAHFSDPDNIGDEQLRQRISEKPYVDSDSTGILIKMVADWQPTTEELRPAILINRGQIDVERLTIGNQVGQDWVTGVASYISNLVGSHTIFAIARTADEADIIAVEVAKVLLVASPIIQKEVNLTRLQLMSVGEASRLEESKDHYAVAISIAYIVTESYDTAPHVPVLKRINFVAE